MKLSKERVSVLAQEQMGWSQNELAHRIGVSRGTLSNDLNGHKGAGRKLLGLLKVFPNESVTSLTVNAKQVAR